MNWLKLILITTPLFVLFGCLDEKVSASQGSNDIVLNAGGTLSTPSEMSFNIPNEISSNSGDNYFSFDVTAGDTVTIISSLEYQISGSDSMSCQMGGTSRWVTLDNSSWCILHYRTTFSSDGTHSFKIQPPSGNFGYFDAAVFPSDKIFQFNANATGRPDDPIPLALGGTGNSVSQNSFYNHFIYDAQAGDTLQIQVYPDQAHSGTQNVSCQNSSGSYFSHASYGIYIFGASTAYNCGTTITYEFQESGQFDLNIRLLNSGGYFIANFI